MCSMAGPVYLVLLAAAVLVRCENSNPTIEEHPVIEVIFGSIGNIIGTSKAVLVNGTLISVVTYWAIPYAKPPTGERRFKRPDTLILNPAPLTINDLVPPKACIQEVDNETIHSADDMSEDCLYLNLWRPSCGNPMMPTLVYIHGGGFLRSGYSAHPLFNGENLAATGCVLVASVNYRLGALGFLHVDTPGFDSNVGLYDVAAALRRIKSIVSYFSGDPHHITVFGSGAGAYLASAFIFSPYLRDNVTSVILQSGSPSMQMLYQSRSTARISASRLGTDLHCDITNKTQLVSCLRQVDARVLMQSFFRNIDGFQYRMVTVMDGEIITRNPFDSLRNRELNNISVMIGTNKDEATEALMRMLPGDFNRNVSRPPVFSDIKINETLTNFLSMLYNTTHLNYLATMVKVLYDYDKVKQTNNSSLAFLSPVANDIAYTCHMRLLLEAYADVPEDVYVYSFNHAPDNTSLPTWVGATHGAEIPYIFRTSTQLSSREIALSEKMQKLWANFAGYGMPTAGHTVGADWPHYSRQFDERMLVITEDAQLRVGTVQGQKCPFWNTIPAEMKLYV